MDYQGKHSGGTIDRQIDRVIDGSVVTENTMHEVTDDDTKPVTGAAIRKEIKAFPSKSVEVVGKGELEVVREFYDVSPNSIYRFHFSTVDPDIISHISNVSNRTVVGFTARPFDSDGGGVSLGDVITASYNMPFKPMEHYDVYFPNLSNYKLRLWVSMAVGTKAVITMEDVTAVKVPYKAVYGTLQTDTGAFVESITRCRIRVPVSSHAGFKRIFVSLPDNLILTNTKNVFAFKGNDYIGPITAAHLKSSINFYNDGSFDNIIVIAKREDEGEIPSVDKELIVSYSDLDSNAQVSQRTVQQMIYVPFEAGQLSTSTGGSYGALTVVDKLLKSKQQLYLEWVEGASIVTELPSDVSIFCYDAGFNLVGVGKPNTMANVSYIKLQSESSIASLAIEVATPRPLGFVKNTLRSGLERLRPMFLSYKMDIPNMGNVEPTLDYQGVQDVVWNNGYIVLPENYDPKGAPVPLAIYCHGSSGYVFSQTSIKQPADQWVTFMAKNGFAVADCSTLTSYYGIGASAASPQDDINVPNNLSLSCYTNLYNYIARNYNIRTDGVYIYGKSAGGMNSALLSNLQPFKVRAVGGLAPSLDFYNNMRYITSQRNIEFAFAQLGIDLRGDGAFFLNAVSAEEKAIMMSSISKIAGFNPIMMHSDMDAESYYDISLSTPWEQMNSNSAIPASIEGAHKIQCAPMKIWHAIDDPAVPIIISRMYQKMVQNGGGVCFLREFPADCGQHFAVDRAENAPRVDYLCKNGEVINIPVAYAELVDWFNQW